LKEKTECKKDRKEEEGKEGSQAGRKVEREGGERMEGRKVEGREVGERKNEKKRFLPHGLYKIGGYCHLFCNTRLNLSFIPPS
jgi:hypothetical protein